MMHWGFYTPPFPHAHPFFRRVLNIMLTFTRSLKRSALALALLAFSCNGIIALAAPVPDHCCDVCYAAPLSVAKTAEKAMTKTAEQTALDWLVLTDSGYFDKAYTETSPLYKQQVSKGQFLTRMGAERTPYGAISYREVKQEELYETSAKLEELRQLVLPEGQYSFVEFQTRFETNPAKNFTETVVLRRENDTVWRVIKHGMVASMAISVAMH